MAESHRKETKMQAKEKVVGHDTVRKLIRQRD